MEEMNELHAYRWDVWYAEWGRGLPEGCISEARIEDGYYAGINPELLVQQEVDRRRQEEDSR
jgi:hypothetical protein